jgi:predicted transcriptional regulator
VTVAHKDMPLNAAARLMREDHVGCLVVIEDTAEGQRVVGLLTDRDIVTAVVAKEVDASTVRVDDVMSRDVATIRSSATLIDVLHALRRKSVRRLPVTGPKGQLMGLVATDDVLEAIAAELHELTASLVAQPQRESRARP